MQTWPAGMTLTNWDLGGAVSEWSYAHAAEWQATKELLPGQAAPELVLQPRPVPSAVQAQVDAGQVRGFTVLVDGAVAHQWPTDVPTPRLLMSVSKVFTSLLVGLLVSDGALHYADEVRTHLPELGPQWAGCRVRHLLDMTSGVLYPEAGDPGSYQDPNHRFFQFEASLGWRPARTHATPYELVAGMGRAVTPGRHYAYTSVNTFLLLWICERTTGKGYAELLQERIWHNLALRSRAAICANSDGTPNPHGGIIMSTDDLARFGTVFTSSAHGLGHHRLFPTATKRCCAAPSDRPFRGTRPPHNQ